MRTRSAAVWLSIIALAVAVPLLASPVARAAQGDHVGSVTFSQNCTSPQGLGVGVAFDGQNLWYSCYNRAPDLLRADPQSGNVTASYNITGGLGAIAYDAVHNGIWAGHGKGSAPWGQVYFIQLDAGRNVVASGQRFVANHMTTCNLNDGLAYDATDGSLYLSHDCFSKTIHHYNATTGAHLADGPNGNGDFSWAGGNNCYNSGLALGGSLLYQGANGCSHVYVVNKTSPGVLVFDFNTTIAGDPNFRDEDLECDTVTFAAQGKQVMWSKEAFNPQRAHAFETPPNTCGFGGEPPPTPQSSSIVTTPTRSTIALGESNTDQAVVTGNLTNPPTGNVSFWLCSPAQAPAGQCFAPNGTLLGTVNLVNGTATSPPGTPTSAGTWCFRGRYNGDANHNASVDDSPEECFTVEPNQVTLTTSSDPAGTHLPGTAVRDIATVAGGAGNPVPTGNVSFFLCGPTEVTGAGCPAGGAFIDNVDLVAGSATSAFTTSATATGRYCWRVAYFGDAFYGAANHTNNDTECFNIQRLLPSLATRSYPQGPDAGEGTEAFDVATVSGSGATPTGTVRFFLCTPGNTTAAGCPAGGVEVAPAATLVNGQARSATTLDTWAPGTYCWRAEYSGDASYEPGTHTNNSTECFTAKPHDLCTEQPGLDVCTEPDEGPACYAVAVHARVAPGLLSPLGAVVPIAPSSANASQQVGSAHGDAQAAGADALGAAGTRAAVSSCDAVNQAESNFACGSARADNLTLDLAPLGVDASLTATVLREDVCSFNGLSGSNRSLTNVTLRLGTEPPLSLDLSQPREINLTPVLHVWVNQSHQDVRGGCLRWHGSALRVRVYDPVGGVPPAAEVLVGWVDTLSCPVGLPPAPDEVPGGGALPVGSASACEATFVGVRVPALGLDLAQGVGDASTAGAGRHARGTGQAARAEVLPGIARAGLLEGRCAADQGAVASANGTATAADVDVDLRPRGVNVWLHVDAVQARADTAGGVGSSGATLAGLRGNVLGVPVPPLSLAVPANTAVGLPGGHRLVLNEQATDPGPCPVHRAASLRLIVMEADGVTVAAEVVVGEVAVSSC